jgi:hypothetical protein
MLEPLLPIIGRSVVIQANVERPLGAVHVVLGKPGDRGSLTDIVARGVGQVVIPHVPCAGICAQVWATVAPVLMPSSSAEDGASSACLTPVPMGM